MLLRLTVRNLAIVSDVSLELGPGLTVVTGETGAGKSVIMDALGLVVGERGSSSLVRPSASSASVEAVFEPRDPARTNRRLAELGLPAIEDGLLIVRREIANDGKNRVFVGNAQALVSTLRELGDGLIDLHAQGDGQGLFRVSQQREWLDASAKAGDLVAKLESCLEEERALGGEIERRREEIGETARQRDYFEHVLGEIDAAKLLPDEEELLRHERALMLGRAKLVEDGGAVCRDLLEDDGAALTRVSRAETSLQRLAEIDPELRPSVELLESARVAMDEVVRTVASRLRGSEFSNTRRDEVEERLDLLATLKRKYGRSVQEIVAYADGIRKALVCEEGSAAEIEALEATRAKKRVEASGLADRLGEIRARASKELARGVTREIAELGMQEARFDVGLRLEPDAASWYRRGGEPVHLGLQGAEAVEFRLAANPGLPPAPLAKVASGGELSRVMLALKVRLVEVDPADVLVFDEIDVGIGGRTARVVGERLSAIAAERQVIAITHLASVACAGERHYRIEKRSDRTSTHVGARLLSDEERVAEVARMLSGSEGDQAAERHARELLAARGGARP